MSPTQAFRDARGRSIVAEFVEDGPKIYDDMNDGGLTGYGIMTNEPELPWQIENVKNVAWKLGRSSPAALAIPGDYYPSSRFERLWLTKANTPPANSYRQAVADAVAVLNTVTVPRGTQPGKDGGHSRTHWGLVYDHKNATVYWRSESNMQLQRLRLRDADIGAGGQQRYVNVESPSLPFYADAADKLRLDA